VGKRSLNGGRKFEWGGIEEKVWFKSGWVVTKASRKDRMTLVNKQH
jgi:hypothetical protein